MAAVGNPTAAEYESWFLFADKDRDGRLTGGDAVAFFSRSGLPREVLAKVWSLADTRRAGFLDRDGFFKAMELLSMAQQGAELSLQSHQQAAEQGIPPPLMEGLAEELAKIVQSKPDLLKPPPTSKKPAPYVPPPPPSKLGSKPSKRQQLLSEANITSIVDGLKDLYMTRLRPLEEAFKFGSFFSPLMSPGDFDATPSVLLLGQYSTGKTTFIKHLLGREYPGIHIGPEPTTDRFVVVMNGHDERRTPGNTLAVQPDRPYQGLTAFGTGFLGRFEGAEAPHPLLEKITLVDTPGVLSGEKQRIERTYDFIKVCSWFAARCDMILLLFDPYKLDISDEFKAVISGLKGHDDKVRVVLNKSDQVDHQQLMRVYGALMWSLGKVFKSPEVCRVYIGSFNSEADINREKNPQCAGLFEAEQQDLMKDLYEIPARSCDRKVNEFVKRVRAAKIHCLLIAAMRKDMPSMFGKKAAQEKILDNMLKYFTQVQQEHQLPAGDFPSPERFREILSNFDLLQFPKLDKRMMKTFDEVLTVDIPALMKKFENPF